VNATLFREEVLRRRRDRLHGAVSLATPLSWQVIGFLLLVILIASLGFLASTSYSRIESVSGAVTLDKGVAAILPSRTGVIAAVMAKDGALVGAGEPLVRIRAEEDMTGGGTVSDRIREALAEQDARLAAQSQSLAAAARADQDRLRVQAAGLAAEVASLDNQIADQHRLIDKASADYAEVQRVAAKGFISRHDVDAREAEVISRRQQLAQLEQLRAGKMADMAEARRAMVQTDASAQAQVASAQSNRAALAQQRAQADLAQGYTITAPVSGIVTALTARLGQRTIVDRPLMLIVPAKARPQVELYVPTAAAGFLALGQDVRLAVDAFPYQQFGTVPARVTEISAAAVLRDGPDGPVAMYLVTAELAHPWVMAFGRRQPLVAGMTLSARIVTARRSLLEWLFEPIFAVQNR